MHIGRMLARLNPKNVRFDVGTGGMPDLTPQDIAAALGCVEDGIGRELLCQVWWPDGARMTEGRLLEWIALAQFDEWKRREEHMQDAMLAVALRGSRAAQLYASAHARRWPRIMTMDQGMPVASAGYARVRHAVLLELKGANLCSACGGRCAIKAGNGLVVVCPACLGTGHQAASERSRADAIGVEWRTYREAWERVYSWTLELGRESITRATRQFVEKLGG